MDINDKIKMPPNEALESKKKKKLDELYPLLKSLKVFFKDHFCPYDMVMY